MCVLILVCASGCETFNGKPDDVAPPPADRPTLRAVIDQYNKNLTRLKRLRGHGVIEMRWVDEDGKKRFEQGDITLLTVPPHHLAMPIQKLGVDLFWLGANDERFWYFDLSGDNKVAWVGTHKGGGDQAASRLPAPIRPGDLIHLLGIIPVRADAFPAEQLDQRVPYVKGDYVLSPPGSRVRMRVAPQSGLAVGADVLDGQGQVRMTCKLSNHKMVEMVGVPPGAWSWVPGRIVVTLPDDRGRVQLELHDFVDDPGRIRSAAFNYAKLLEAKKPGRVIDLDK